MHSPSIPPTLQPPLTPEPSVEEILLVSTVDTAGRRSTASGGRQNSGRRGSGPVAESFTMAAATDLSGLANGSGGSQGRRRVLDAFMSAAQPGGQGADAQYSAAGLRAAAPRGGQHGGGNWRRGAPVAEGAEAPGGPGGARRSSASSVLSVVHSEQGGAADAWPAAPAGGGSLRSAPSLKALEGGEGREENERRQLMSMGEGCCGGLLTMGFSKNR